MSVAILASHDFNGEAFAIGPLAFPATSNLLISLPLAALVAGIAAALMGAVSLRTSGSYFIMITLAFNQMLYYLFVGLQKYGGEDGLQILGSLSLGSVDPSHRVPFFYAALTVLAATLIFMQRLVGSRFGMVIRAAAQNERRVMAVGIPPLRYKLTAFAISGALAGIAGGLLAASQQFISPADMSWVRSGDLVVMCVLGGLATVWGPVIGAAVFLILEFVLSGYTTHWQLPFGLIVIALAVFLKGGLDGHCQTRWPRREGAKPMSATPMLSTRNLVKRFGGVVATSDVSLEIAAGETHALIGPNGAGKTTLISQLQGELPPTSGTIHFKGQDITREPPHRRAQLGLARSFQITSVLPEFTALENVRLAVQARLGHSFRLWRAAARDTALNGPAMDLLHRVGLDARAGTRADVLSHGERRQLELAMALAMQPALLLLDEPMAGMGKQDAARMIRLLAELKQSYTIVLVEHDMDAVFALADRLSVLVQGRVIATGLPDEIRNNADVKAAYLGHH